MKHLNNRPPRSITLSVLRGARKRVTKLKESTLPLAKIEGALLYLKDHPRSANFPLNKLLERQEAEALKKIQVTTIFDLALSDLREVRKHLRDSRSPMSQLLRYLHPER